MHRKVVNADAPDLGIRVAGVCMGELHYSSVAGPQAIAKRLSAHRDRFAIAGATIFSYGFAFR